MPNARRCRLLIALAVFLLFAVGCSSRTKPQEHDPAYFAPQPATDQELSVTGHEEEAQPVTDQELSVTGHAEETQPATCLDKQAVRTSERNRAACARLQPAKSVTKVSKQRILANRSKRSAGASKKTAKTAVGARAKTKSVRTTGRCQPQCMIYARCRSGIYTCRIGDTNPVRWFACAAKHKGTTSVPHSGSVMIFPVNAGNHRMPSGHAVYVEDAKKLKDGIWQLRISHTNYDRKCHLDQDVIALFDQKRMVVTLKNGHWRHWGVDLNTLGFILR
jgi:hypothetical protein